MKWRLVHLEHCWDASPKSNPNTNLFFPQNDLRPVRTVAHSLFGCCAVENQIRRTAYYQRNHNLDILSAAYSWNWRVCVCVFWFVHVWETKRENLHAARNSVEPFSPAASGPPAHARCKSNLYAFELIWLALPIPPPPPHAQAHVREIRKTKKSTDHRSCSTSDRTNNIELGRTCFHRYAK